MANSLAVTKAGEVKEVNSRIVGHLMVIRKSTWSWILPTIQQTAGDKKVLGVPRIHQKWQYQRPAHYLDIPVMLRNIHHRP
jgi:hypothetical protein